MKPCSVVLALALMSAGCSSDHALLRSRAADWRTALDVSVPPGTSIQAARAWGAQKGLSFQYIETQRQLYAIAERVPEQGLNKFVCSEWSVILKVTFADSGLSEKNEVSTVGTCL